MFKNAVVGIDGEHGGRDAVALARQLGAPGARITLAHIYGVGLVLHGGWHHLLSSQREVALERLDRERDTASVDAPVVAFVDRSVGRGLHRLAESEVADLLVVGSCRRSLLGRVLLGSDTRFALNGARVRSRSRRWGMPRGLTRSPRSGSGTTARGERACARRRPGTRSSAWVEDQGAVGRLTAERPVRADP